MDIKYFTALDSDCVWEDFDQFGGDGDIDTQKTPNFTRCQEGCKKNPQCKKWTFKTGNMTGKCYLRKQNGTTIPTQPCNGRCITGFRKNNQQICGQQKGKFI